jgi:hypothetical protein
LSDELDEFSLEISDFEEMCDRFPEGVFKGKASQAVPGGTHPLDDASAISHDDGIASAQSLRSRFACE